MKGFLFIRLHLNSVLPEINELRNITKLSDTAVAGISETKIGQFHSLSKYALLISIRFAVIGTGLGEG